MMQLKASGLNLPRSFEEMILTILGEPGNQAPAQRQMSAFSVGLRRHT